MEERILEKWYREMVTTKYKKATTGTTTEDTRQCLQDDNNANKRETNMCRKPLERTSVA